eukprot:gene4723-8307_t
MEDIELNDLHTTINEDQDKLLNSVEPKKINYWKKTISFLTFIYNNAENQIIQTYHEMINRKINFGLGILSCLVVVCMVAIAQTAVGHLPRVFLRLAELSNGEFDAQITLQGGLSGTVMNYSLITSRNVFKYGDLSFSAPRYIHRLDSYAASSCKGDVPHDLTNNTVGDGKLWKWTYVGASGRARCGGWCVPRFCNRRRSSLLFVIDSQLEAKMGMGIEWIDAFGYKLPNGTVYIAQAVADSLKVEVGDVIIIPITNTIGLMREAGFITDKHAPNSAMRRINIPVVVGAIFSDVSIWGKFDDSDSTAMVMEYNGFISHITKYLHPGFNQKQVYSFSKTNLYASATHLYFNMPDRLEAYNSPYYQDTQNKVAKFGSRILYFLGYTQVNAEYRILKYLSNTQLINLFTGLIMNLVIAIVSILSVLLVYSLLLVNVENRTFELGVLRMLGMSKHGVVSLVLLQAFTYAFPGWLGGLIAGQGLYLIIDYLFRIFLQLDMSMFISTKAAVVATVLGFGLPIISSLYPMYNALQYSLRDSLDTVRSRTVSVMYKIERSDDSGMSWNLVIIGSFTAGYGAVIYYFFPLALMALDISLLMWMLFLLLICMIVGMSVLALNFETIFERTLTILFLFWENYAVRNMVSKNLISHRVRNRKTTVMAALSLSFIIFITVAFRAEIDGLKYVRFQEFGSKVRLEAWYPTSIIGRLSHLENYLHKEPLISGYTFKSYKLGDVTNVNTTLSNIGHYDAVYQNIYAISQNFFEIVDRDFYYPSKIFPSGFDIGHQLYTSWGSGRIILGSLYESMFHFDLNSKVKLVMSLKTNDKHPPTKTEILKPVGFLRSSTVFKLSEFPQRRMQDALVSFPTFVKFTQNGNSPHHRVDTIPIQHVYIKFQTSATQKEIDVVRQKLMHLGIPMSVSDSNEKIVGLQIANDSLFAFSVLTTIIVMIMCFFSLTSSMYTNVIQQSKEIAILRALGTRRFPIMRIYLYESFILIISSLLMGLVIGSFVAYTYISQRSLFTQLQLPFIFPYQMTIIVFIIAGILSFFSSVIPIYMLLFDSITNVMRRIQ